VHVTGTATVVYSMLGSMLHAVLTSTGLKVNGATANLNATGDFSMVNSTKTATITTTTAATGQRGTAIQRGGSYTASWDSTCMSLDGSWMTTVLGHTWSTVVANFKKCMGQCPAAGGVITYTGGLTNVTTTVTLDGTGTAKWATSRGSSGSIDLLCK
jgi:hypothetical protein